jgi:hypothetical protein
MTLLTNNKKKDPFVGNIISKEQKEVKTSANNSNPSLLGKDFNYAGAIRSPGELGISSAPTMGALSADIAGLLEYTNVLISGNGRAVKGKLGNQYFLKTLAKCKLNGRDVDRYLYINNVPTGNISFGGTSLTGRSSLRGLVPGMMEGIGKINPLSMFKAFSEGTPQCIKCPSSVCPVTIGGSNKPISKSDYEEIKKLRESFANIEELKKNNSKPESITDKIMNNKIDILYKVSISLLAAYVTYRLITKY